jgi:hypothetical protein
MSDSADARAFAVLTAPEGAISGEYRDIAKQVANADTLSEFLGEFRKRYPDTPQVPLRQPPGGKPAEQEPGAGTAEGGVPKAEEGAPQAGTPAAEAPAEGGAAPDPGAGAQAQPQAPAQG